MKKTYLLPLFFIALLFTNCKKDDEGGEEEQTSVEKKAVPTIVKSYDANGTLTSTDTYTYDERLITKKTTVGTDTTVFDYYYSDSTKGLLDSIVATKNGVFAGVTKYFNDNDLISRTESYNANRELEVRQDFTHYTGTNPDQFRILIRTAQYGDINIVGTMTYTSGNMTSMNLTGTVSGISFNQSTTATYDTNNIPFLNVTTLFEPKTSVNNVLTMATDMNSSMGNQHQEVTMTYNYNADKYPTRVDITQDNQSQGYMEYTYEDK
jgi:hypothetical protein